MSDIESQRQKAAKAVHGISANRARRPHTAKKANRAPRVEAPVDLSAVALNDTLTKLDTERNAKKVTENAADGSRKFFTDMDTHEANEKRLLKQAKAQHEHLHSRQHPHPHATKKKIAWGLFGSNRVWKREDGTEVVIKGGRKRRSRARRRRRRRRTHRRARRKKRRTRRRRNKKSRKRRRRK